MLIPQGIGALLCRGIVGRLTDTIGARPIAVVGFVIVAAATIPFAYADPNTNAWLLGVLAAAARRSASARSRSRSWRWRTWGLTRPRSPHASVLTRTAQQIGGSFGTAVLAVILESAVAARHGDLIAAFHVAFWWAVGFAALAALLSIWLPGRPGAASNQATAGVGARQGSVGTGQPVR